MGKADRDARVRPATRPEVASTKRATGGGARQRYMDAALNEVLAVIETLTDWTDVTHQPLAMPEMHVGRC